MKIFGIGLSRTGTVSLTWALRWLGYTIIHAPLPIEMPWVIEAVRRVGGATDSAVAFRYKELDKEFLNSKFILTTREITKWLKSYEHWLSIRPPFEGEFAKFQKRYYGSITFNRKTYKQAFIKHHKEVLEYFKDRNDLLIMDLSNGDFNWDKLCDFIWEKPTIKFPYNNRSGYK